MLSNQKIIVVVGGYWSTNIGNSFFQLGAKYLLEQIFPNDNIVMLSDQPGFWNTKIGNPSNAFNLLDHIKPDYFVILGPFLRSEYKRIWHKTLKILCRKKVKIIILGAGMMKYQNEEIKHCKTLLAETPPYIFASRDTETYQNFADLAEHSYDGIDPAFFVSDFFIPIPVNLNRYLILNFDKIPEPGISVSNKEFKNKPCFEFENIWWNFRFSRFRRALHKRFKFLPFVDAFLPNKSYPEKIGDFTIIRTDHGFNPMLLRKVYKGMNSFVSDLPFTYLNLYANTTITFSNRVHACVATLAYRKPAMLFSDTPRARLLERLGLNHITKKPEYLSSEKLKDEKDKMIGFLRSVLIWK